MKPLVSVIITTYGRTDFLEKAIQSVINQTYKNIEIIVVDDNAKKPEVRKCVKSIISKFNISRFICTKKNLGGSLARNEGIKVAKGEFISFLDDDDLYKNTRIERYIDEYYKANEKNIGLVYGYVDVIDVEERKIGEYKIDIEDKPIYQNMHRCIAATSQWIVPAYVFNSVGMFEDSPCKQDSIMLLKILGAGFKLLCVKECLGSYRQHDQERISGIGRKNIEGIENYINWSRKYYDKLSLWEQKDVENSFASELLTIYILRDEKDKAKEQLKKMCKIKMFSKLTIKAWIKYLIGKKYLILIREVIWKYRGQK